MQLAEVKTLVREIQSLIAGPLSEDDEPDIIDLAAQHDEVVSAMIDRADDVADLLDRGLNDEAIQLAERAPQLADLSMLLDFPELSEWSCVLAENLVAAVPELPHDTIAQLEDAYSTTTDSKKLLQKFRTLSLARAPLNDRIDVLRRLSDKDPGNEQWTDGIQTYESYRLKSIGEDLKTARDQKDLAAVANIDRELNQAQWTVKVPSNLRTDAQTAHRKLRQADARKKIAPIAEELSGAYAEFDIPKATQALGRFRAIADIAQLPPDHEIMDIAVPAVQWIEGELSTQQAANERQQAIAKLQSGLDADAPLTELESYYYEATKDGTPVPPVLETRLTNKISATAVAEKRKRVAVVASSVTAVALLIAAVVGLVVKVNFNSRVAKNTQQITQLLKDADFSGNTAPLESRFEELKSRDPAVLASPEIAALEKKLQALSTREQGRVRSFNTLLATVEHAAKDPKWSTIKSAETLLNEANALTKNENERAEMLQTRQRLTTARATLQKLTDKQFTTELEAVRALTQQVNTADSETYDTPIARIDTALKLENVSPDTRSQGQALLAKLTTERSIAEQQQIVSLDLSYIARSTTSIETFESSMESYVRKHPGTQRAAEFTEIRREEADMWKAVATWNQFRRDVPSDLQNMTPSQAKSWLTGYQEFLKSEYSGAARITNRVKAIEAIARRTTSATGSEPAITNLFSGRFMRDCYSVKTDSQWYYTDTKPSFRTSSIVKFNYFENGFSSNADRSTSIPTNEIRNTGLDHWRVNPDKIWLSAQSVLAVKVDDITANPKLDFEQTIQAVMSLVLNAKDMDPLLHLLLIENILSVGGSGSTFIQQNAAVVQASLAKIRVPRTADWVNPKSALTAERNEARRQISLHSRLIPQALSKAIEHRDRELATPVGPAMKITGWFHRDPDDRWAITLTPGTQHKPGSDLVMFHLQSGKPSMSIVGRTTKDRPLVETSIADAQLREGRPVFIRSE